mgnify:FL=1|tara:strand:- start:2237 stop:2698 length:462 start_codon:yes stop_codon:yes gene_type:complete
MKLGIIKLFLFLFIASCGFKVVEKTANYKILEIYTEGDKKINFIIKNNLLLNSNIENSNLINLTINTNKKKAIKERNISNQITKYEITIVAQVKYEQIKNNSSGEFVLSRNGSYDVGDRHSETLNSERNLINLMVDDISDNIMEELTNILNDL